MPIAKIPVKPIQELTMRELLDAKEMAKREIIEWKKFQNTVQTEITQRNRTK